MTTTADLTPEQRAAMVQLRRVRARLDRANARLAQIEDDRAAAYVAARACTPPLTFQVIADEFGVTESAVMQKHKRAVEKLAGA